LLKDGLTLAIIGRPNAGKSSLLNALTGRDSAIVTEIPGTTRDLVREQINMDGLPLHLIDTAGIRDTGDQVEAEGVRRARDSLLEADLVLLVVDANSELSDQLALKEEIPGAIAGLVVFNKSDLSNNVPDSCAEDEVWISAKTGEGPVTKAHLQPATGTSMRSTGCASTSRQAGSSCRSTRPGNFWPKNYARHSRRWVKSPANSAVKICSGRYSRVFASVNKSACQKRITIN
jgi:tRNA modification GTPase